MPAEPPHAEYVEALAPYTGARRSVFLAGGITDCPDWQAEAVAGLADLPIAILNPRRATFPIHDPGASAAQIAWEFEHLRRADAVLFWFPAGGAAVQPIALYELGAHAATGKPMVVGADPGYPRSTDVVLQMGHVRPDLRVYASLMETIAAMRRLITGMPPTGGASRPT